MSKNNATKTNESTVNFGGDLKVYKISLVLNGKTLELDTNNVFEAVLRHYYYRNYAAGYLKLRDSTGVFDILTTHFSLTILFEMQDCLGLRHKESFAVTNINRVSDAQHGLLVYLEFVDEITNLFSLTHFPRGYKNVTIIDVIADIYGNVKNGLSMQKRFSVSDTKKYFEKKDFVIPGNISVYQWIREQEYYENFEFIVGRSTISILSTKDIWKNTHSTGINLISANPKVLTPMTIKEVQVVQDSLQLRVDMAPAISYSLKEGTNTILPTTSGPTVSLTDIGTGGKFKYSGNAVHIGSKITPYDGVARQKFCNSKMLEDQTLAVDLAMGSFMYCPTMKVSTEIKPSIAVSGHKIPYLNGEYMVTYVEDVITGNFFGQNITLSRPGFAK